MTGNVFGPMGDPQFWGDVGRNAVNPSKLLSTLKGFGTSAVDAVVDPIMRPAYRAGDISKAAFPEQDWELSQRNALRHSAWVGGMAQAMGASPDNPIATPFAQLAAKGAGYAHEVISSADDWFTGKPRGAAESRDTSHDFNNNAVGAEVAGRTRNNEDLYRALTSMAVNARMGDPVNRLSISEGRLSADRAASVPRKPIQFPTRG